ncbi:hypothetical protein C3L33_11913, partial [Rhododendron williamsianum]
MLMSLLIGSLSDEVFPLVVGLTTSKAIWETLEASLGSPSNTRILQLHMQLQQIRQEDKSVSSFLHRAKSISDELAAAGHPLSPTDFNIYVFKVLRSKFKDLVTTLAARPDPVSFAELHALLLSHEFLNADSFASAVTISAAAPDPSPMANLVQRNGPSNRDRGTSNSNRDRNFNRDRGTFISGGRSRGRGRGGRGQDSRSFYGDNRSRCQICNGTSHMASTCNQRLRNVDLLSVKSCIGVTEVFHVDGLEVGESQECVGSLIQVREIQLNTLPMLTCLWNKDPLGLLRLQNLEYLAIKDCPLLRNLLTASVAKALGGLKVLYLRSCSTMEEVVFATDEGHEEVIDDQEIVFPKLEWLILKDLSNLKSFCSANYNFNLPSLQRVVVKRCPNMQTFTYGSVRMPPTMFIARGDDGPVIEDLNKHLEQQHPKGDQETIEDYFDMYSAEEKFFDLHL